jgi:hypothetical protein
MEECAVKHRQWRKGEKTLNLETFSIGSPLIQFSQRHRCEYCTAALKNMMLWSSQTQCPSDIRQFAELRPAFESVIVTPDKKQETVNHIAPNLPVTVLGRLKTAASK